VAPCSSCPLRCSSVFFPLVSGCPQGRPKLFLFRFTGEPFSLCSLFFIGHEASRPVCSSLKRDPPSCLQATGKHPSNGGFVYIDTKCFSPLRVKYCLPIRVWNLSTIGRVLLFPYWRFVRHLSTPLQSATPFFFQTRLIF